MLTAVCPDQKLKFSGRCKILILSSKIGSLLGLNLATAFLTRSVKPIAVRVATITVSEAM